MNLPNKLTVLRVLMVPFFVLFIIGGTVDRHAARQYRVRFGGWVEPVL